MEERTGFEARVEALLEQMDKRLGGVERRLDSLDSHIIGMSSRLEQKAGTTALAIWCSTVMGWLAIVAGAAVAFVKYG